MDPIKDSLMAVLKDKKALMKFLIKAIEESTKEKNGLAKLSESLTREEPNLKPENIARCVSTTMLVTAKQSHRLETMAVIALVQCSSKGFDSNIAELLNKLGYGNEALSAMFDNILKGK